MKKVWIIFVSMVLFCGAFLGAESSENNYRETTPQFSINPTTDGVAIGVGVLGVGAITLWGKSYPGIDKPLPPEDLRNVIDGIYVASTYSSGQNSLSLVTTLMAIATPVLLVTPSEYRDRWLTYGVMYTESLLYTFLVKDLIKMAIPKYRPYAYYETTPLHLLADGNVQDSTPSGHTALAFQSAAFISTVALIEDFPDPWKYSLIGGSFGLALSTAVLRVTSGSHYISDVLGGAILGSAVGLVTPLLHRSNGSSGVGAFKLQVAPIPGVPSLGLLYRG